MLSETVVAFDSSDRLSTRHILRRNGPHTVECGEKLPFGTTRYAEGFDTDRDSPEANCRPCMFARAKWLVESMFGAVPSDAAKLVNATDDLDEKIVVLLRVIVKGTSVQPSALMREHFPRTLVERAAV